MHRVPKIDKHLLFVRTREAINPPKQLQLFRTGVYRKPKPVTRDEIISEAFNQANRLSDAYAMEHWKKHKRLSFKKLKREAQFRLLTHMFTWPELFNEYHGFASEKNSYRHNERNKYKGKMEAYKGIDDALRRLYENGMRMNEIMRVTRVLLTASSPHVERYLSNYIHQLEGARRTSRQIAGTPAAQLYAEVIKPQLLREKILPEEFLHSEDKMAQFDHNVIFILQNAMLREISRRASAIAYSGLKSKGRRESEKDRRIRIALDRGDVRELLEKGERLEDIMSMLPQIEHKPAKKIRNRFRARNGG